MTLARRRTAKPVPRKKDLGAYGDAYAIIAGPEEYKRRLAEMCVRQGHRCGMCHQPFTESRPATFRHECSRGGGKRDDLIWREDGSFKNAALCEICNGVQGSRRFAWFDGEWKASK